MLAADCRPALIPATLKSGQREIGKGKTRRRNYQKKKKKKKKKKLQIQAKENLF